MKIICTLLGVVASLAVVVSADTTPPVQLQNVSVSELGAWAAQQVTQVADTQRADVTRDTVAAAIKQHPTATVLVVGAVARAHPTMAPEAVAAAVKQQPAKVFAIVSAALEAAPSEVRGVVRSASRVAPKHYRTICLLAARLVPNADQQVLTGLAEGVPNLKNLLDLASASGRPAQVSQDLAQVDAWVSAAAKSYKVSAPVLLASDDGRLSQYAPPPGPPTQGPPYNALPAVPSIVNAADGTAVPTGGRGYAAP